MTAADCRATLQRAGLRVTPAREAVIAAFMRERRALDARDLIRIAVDARGRPVKPATAYRVLRDLWRHDEREGDGNLDVSIPAHATVVYRIRAR